MIDPAPFEAERRHLFAVAYRLLGSAAEAEDAIQEAWLRWRAADAVENPRAWLVTVVVRLCLDQLGSARARREAYFGPWLPEPIREVDEPDAADEIARRETVSLAFLHLLERLTPHERAVVVLHEAFGWPYADIGPVIDRTEAACRQLHKRARERLAQEPRRPAPSQAERERLVVAFLMACRTGDLDALKALLREDAVWTADGGGKVAAAGKPIAGADRIAKFVAGLGKLIDDTVGVTLERVNGEIQPVIWYAGRVGAVWAFELDGDRIAAVHAVVAPDKLAPLAKQLGAEVSPAGL
jgi:RNA polymerase sigma-70 factor (TIGR02957 family)